MEFFPPVPIDQVGGLEPFKEYLNNRIRAFEPGNDHLPKPKALLLVGIPGTGKSLSCKAAASILELASYPSGYLRPERFSGRGVRNEDATGDRYH